MLVSDENSRLALGPLQKLLVGGEPLSADLAQELRQAITGEVYNMYGPTETTVWSTTCRVGPAPGGVTPIGRPIANTTALVLDRSLQLMPAGVAGELFIGGPGVTRGYLHRPELTADRFIGNLLGKGRMYRTGDLVRRSAEGVLEFVGRTDHQVKIRGHRVELGEVEGVLRQHPAVRDAVVVAREDAIGAPQLVAYVVSHTQRAGTHALRDFVRSRLPEPMVPSAFVALEAVPLTPNGKIDRKNLPAPELAPASGRVAYAAPGTDLERTIASAWQEVLPQTWVGVNDNFFEMGGHSLLMVQVHGRLKKKLGRDVSLIKMFRYPTVSLLAAHLAKEDNVAPALAAAGQRAEIRKQALQRLPIRQSAQLR
jgi:hypothetical protein